MKKSADGGVTLGATPKVTRGTRVLLKRKYDDDYFRH